MKSLVAFVAGVIFAVGLGLSGMTEPAKVIGFLDLFGHWDPTLAFVMAGAIGVHLPASLWARRQGMFLPAVPCAGEAAPGAAAGPDPRPAALESRATRQLAIGSVVFGVGWGVAGYCPGPAVVSLASGAPAALVFVASMLLGMWIYRLASRVPRLRAGDLPGVRTSAGT